MSVGVWFSGLRVDVNKARRVIQETASLINAIRRELLEIEGSLLSGALERDFTRLHKLLVELSDMGILDAGSYSSRAHLLAEYVRALRVRVIRLGPRGISDAREEILHNLDDIDAFIKRLQELLS